MGRQSVTYHFGGRNPKFSVWMHLWMKICGIPFLCHCDLDHVWSISPILFEVGIPNSACAFILGWRSGPYHSESLWPWHGLLTSFLGFSCLEHISFITNNFPQMCLMLDQFFGGICHITVTFLVYIKVCLSATVKTVSVKCCVAIVFGIVLEHTLTRWPWPPFILQWLWHKSTEVLQLKAALNDSCCKCQTLHRNSLSTHCDNSDPNLLFMLHWLWHKSDFTWVGVTPLSTEFLFTNVWSQHTWYARRTVHMKDKKLQNH